ncbi:glutamate receptor ionotropic, kainate 3 [Eurytemora carolleeae]|uniref:glutamate receptor ionotropic, kainate 3 n=1 Tax=Eurytemora carolleeae TaxID=1294199 RepID=UPI000C79395E|nr:glutamate receptor ionotropic, kainate 3 [Eurytemora carolleeae]|eukprot:XP_023344678.1 glutamate receptor ionotropic, kainate 3-like [Eurytemora affinis]
MMKALGLTLLLYDLVLQRSAHAVNSSTNIITAAGTKRTALHTVHVNTVWDIYERTRFKTVYFYLCNEDDEKLLELLYAFYNTDMNLNPKVRQTMENMRPVYKEGSLIYFCQTPEKNLEIKGSSIGVFVNTVDIEYVKKIRIEGADNQVFFVNEEGFVNELHVYKAVTSEVSYGVRLNSDPQTHERVNLRGMQLIVGYLNASSYVQYNGQFSGTQGMLFELMKGMMNFTYSALPSVDGFYGSKVEGGMKHKGKTSQFNGLIGMLERSEIDVALSDLSLTFTRSQVADFGGKMLLQPTYCLITKPGKEISYEAYVNPLGKDIWMWVFICTIGLTTYMFGLQYVSGMLSTEKIKSQDETIPGKILISLGYVCRTMANIDLFLLEIIKFKWAWRILFLSFLVLGYMTVQVYNAELTSYLTSKVAKLPIDRMEDILDRSDLYLALPKGSFFVTLMEFATEGVYKRLYEEKVKGKEYGVLSWSDDEVLLKAIQANYVVIGFGSTALGLIGRYPCEITKLPIEPMFPTQLGIYLKKNSSLTKIFEEQLQLLQEGGIVNTIQIQADREESRKYKVCENTNLKLGIQGTISMFIVVGVGIGAGLCLLILELIIKPPCTQKRKPKQVWGTLREFQNKKF